MRLDAGCLELLLRSLVEHRAGDLMTDDLGSGWDVVLLSNILHHFQEESILAILSRAHAALAADGSIAIWEIERPGRDAKPSEGDGVALWLIVIARFGD